MSDSAERRNLCLGTHRTDRGDTPMAKFMDVHSGFEGVTAAQLEEAHRADLKIEAEEGVHFEKVWLDTEAVKAFWLSTGPREESSMGLHERACHPVSAVDQTGTEAWVHGTGVRGSARVGGHPPRNPGSLVPDAGCGRIDAMSTVAIVSPGYMGAGLGWALRQGGARVVPPVHGRSERTGRLAAEAGLE